MLSEKGKYASATENRRFVWANIVWPLILDVNDVAFSLQQFQNKRDIVCKEKNISINIPSRGLVSLMQKGIIRKEDKIYSIHFRLIPYMRL
jgi:flavin reductase (DIM6/NTAB) family NADH-FMN oxidoreductase RutF